MNWVTQVNWKCKVRVLVCPIDLAYRSRLFLRQRLCQNEPLGCIGSMIAARESGSRWLGSGDQATYQNLVCARERGETAGGNCGSRSLLLVLPISYIFLSLYD